MHSRWSVFAAALAGSLCSLSFSSHAGAQSDGDVPPVAPPEDAPAGEAPDEPPAEEAPAEQAPAEEARAAAAAEAADNEVEDGFTERKPAPEKTPSPELEEELPFERRLSRRHIAFGMGGGPVFFGSILGDAHYGGSNVGGLVNLGLGDHVDLRAAIVASPSASSRGLFLPIGGNVELRFGSTTHPVSAGFGVGFGYLFVPDAPAGADHWVPQNGLFVRPEVVPLALQIQRFELEVYAGLDFVEQRLYERTRFAPGFVSGGLRFYLVGYDTDEVVLK